MAYCATNGNLYENGKAFELKVGIGADFKVPVSYTHLTLPTNSLV